MHHFYVSKYNQWERKQVRIRIFEKKQRKNDGWRENLRTKAKYFVGKYVTT